MKRLLPWHRLVFAELIASTIEKELSGFPAQDSVSSWTLTGEGGLVVTVLTYGGIVSKLTLPDKKGAPIDLVLGFSDPADYAKPHPYFGAIAGRIAGRVTKGEMKVEGSTYRLPINDPPNHLHGGPDSLDRKIWKAEPLERSDGAPSLRLSMRSENGENGYPGTVDFTVTYTVTAENRLIFETTATSDRVTPVSLTHHSYFNLAGEGSGDTSDQVLEIFANDFFQSDDAMGLSGALLPVAGRANDLRKPGRLGDVVPQLHKEHGDLYWLGESAELRPVARLSDPRSGRTLEVSTDCSCLQFYSGKSLDGTLTGKSGSRYKSFAGVCLECEGYPNSFSPDSPGGSILVHPGKPQHTRTDYHFSQD